MIRKLLLLAKSAFEACSFLFSGAVFPLREIRRRDCILAVQKNEDPAPVQARGLEVHSKVLREAGYANRALRPSRATPSNPAVRSVKVPDSGAEVTEEEERSLDTAKAFPPPLCVPLAFQ